MTKSKKIFVFAASLFAAFLVYISIDISRKTTFPGSKSQLKERLKKQYFKDTVKRDTTSLHR